MQSNINGIQCMPKQRHIESLEELETKLQELARTKKQSSQLVEDYEKLQKRISQSKGVEK